MKRLLTLALALVPLLGMAQDDLYFTSSKKAKEEAKIKEAEQQQLRSTIKRVVQAQRDSIIRASREAALVDYKSNKRSEDEYNRRYVYGGQYNEDSLAAHIDSVPSGSNYASAYDIADAEWDYRFSRRLVRFHNPRLYALASPYYWDLYYGYGAWDYLYDPWDPWFYHYGWTYGWTWGPWDCWYGGIWGYSHPYAWSYWGWGPSWGYPIYAGFGPGSYGRPYYHNSVPRSFNSQSSQMAAGNRIRTNATGGRSVGTRTNALASSQTPVMGGRTNVGNSRVNPTTGRTSALAGRQDVQTRGTSYSDYANQRTGRTSATTQTPRTQVYNRAGQVQNGQTQTRSYSNQNSSSRTSAVQQQQTTRTQAARQQVQQQQTQQQQTRTRTQTVQQTQQSTPTRSYTPTTTSSGSFGGGSFGGGGGSFGGGGGSRGGGGGGGRR